MIHLDRAPFPLLNSEKVLADFFFGVPENLLGTTNC